MKYEVHIDCMIKKNQTKKFRIGQKWEENSTIKFDFLIFILGWAGTKMVLSYGAA